MVPDSARMPKSQGRYAVDPQPGNVVDQLFSNDDLGLSFLIPESWFSDEVERAERSVRSAEFSPFTAMLQSAKGDSLGISIFWTQLESLEKWIERNHAFSIREGVLDFRVNEVVLSGKEAYLWKIESTSGHDKSGFVLVAKQDERVFQFGFPEDPRDPAAIVSILESIVIGEEGPTKLPLDFSDPGATSALAKTSSCPGCTAANTDSDTYTNGYPRCCTTHGNCTWKCEQMRSGSNNFSFGGVSGRHAYRWMTLARQHTSYALGGTIPTVGAVVVAGKSVGPYGHVATVTSIGSNGSITVSEQNCDYTCTQPKTYDLAWLRTHLAGYIYSSSTAPSATPKTVASSGETVIEDHSGTNIYHFSTSGPGSFMSFNGNERSWGTHSTGSSGSFMHFVLSRTGTAENTGQWRGQFLQGGTYELQAWIPNNSYAAATSLQYEVGGLLSSRINQSTNKGKWVKISNPARSDGNWVAGGAGNYSVTVRDTSNSTAGQSIAFDAIKWIRRG